MLKERFVSNYLVGYFDVLGQKKKLKKLDLLPSNDPKKKEKVEKYIKETVKVVNGFQEDFIKKFKGLEENRDPILKRIFPDLKIDFQRFTDGIVAYSNMRLDKHPNHFDILYRFLYAACAQILIQLYHGHPIRGGIDIGLGMNVEKSGIYGSCVVHAYELESQVAGYPRIVIGNYLIHYLNDILNKIASTDKSKSIQRWAEKCNKFIHKDKDGNYICHYLGEEFLSYFIKEDEEVSENPLINKAYKFVKNEYEKFNQKNNQKLSKRYEKLKDYFEKNI
ncbi:MAG: hypothetical protein FXF47_08490 [Candidatus Mcinerneyibacterium aminivorans]|uniref:Adenylate/guanylate cyclase domain-containing protein n=1 Tax=Candidatus Mcinerneyibacterium aminivorans TaxID=2703815 RepID=A0A5D0MG68_9BACT|nr:MAG: hypothetical protein FXF47_08490 [Candidatus Mcinerneyibacterium aminivorans]